MSNKKFYIYNKRRQKIKTEFTLKIFNILLNIIIYT